MSKQQPPTFPSMASHADDMPNECPGTMRWVPVTYANISDGTHATYDNWGWVTNCPKCDRRHVVKRDLHERDGESVPAWVRMPEHDGPMAEARRQWLEGDDWT